MGRHKGTKKLIEEDKVKWERWNERNKRLKKIKSAHRQVIFGDAPDTLVIPEGVVFECEDSE